MNFSGGKLSVFGGLNRLTASYALVGKSVTMGEISSTKMAGPPELMALESKFAKILASVSNFHVHGDELELLSDGKVVAVLRANN